MVYNLTNLTSSTSVLSVMQFNNEVTNGLFAISLLITLFIVTFIAMKNFPTGRAFASAIYITFVVSALFRVAGLIENNVFLIMILLTAISSVALLKFD